MAVLRVKEIHNGRVYREGDDALHEYVRVFLVETDNKKDDGAIAAKTAPGIPNRFDYYSTSTTIDVTALCREIEAEQIDESPFWWKVTCNFTNKHGDPADEEENPLNEPPEIEFSYETIERPVWFYLDQSTRGTYGNALIGTLTNGAGDPFDPPPTYDDSRTVVTITRNQQTYDPFVAKEYTNAVNSDVFWNCPPRTWKCRGITGTLQTKNGVTYWRATAVLALKEESWDLVLLNQGYRYRNSAGSTDFTSFIGANGPFLGLLRSNGTQYTSTTFSSTDLVLSYRILKERPFGFLNLPFSPNR